MDHGTKRIKRDTESVDDSTTALLNVLNRPQAITRVFNGNNSEHGRVSADVIPPNERLLLLRDFEEPISFEGKPFYLEIDMSASKYADSIHKCIMITKTFTFTYADLQPSTLLFCNGTSGKILLWGGGVRKKTEATLTEQVDCPIPPDPHNPGEIKAFATEMALMRFATVFFAHSPVSFFWAHSWYTHWFIGAYRFLFVLASRRHAKQIAVASDNQLCVTPCMRYAVQTMHTATIDESSRCHETPLLVVLALEETLNMEDKSVSGRGDMGKSYVVQGDVPDRVSLLDLHVLTESDEPTPVWTPGVVAGTDCLPVPAPPRETTMRDLKLSTKSKDDDDDTRKEFTLRWKQGAYHIVISE